MVHDAERQPDRASRPQNGRDYQVGNVDPKTLQFHEYRLPDPAWRARRIAIASDDIVWYSDYWRGFFGRLDPATGKVTEWPSQSGPKSEPA